MPSTAEITRLPAPETRDGLALALALLRRRSTREFSERELTREEIGQVLSAAQGVTDAAEELRTAPSAGALFPLELYAATAHGVFRHRPQGHRLVRRGVHDVRRRLRRAALDQPCVGNAPCVFVIAGVVQRTTGKYGERALRYVPLQAGHAAQNILLQAVALSLAAVPIGAFEDDEVARALEPTANETPLYLIPVGRPCPVV